MGLYVVANSCVKAVTAAREPGFCRPSLKGYSRRYRRYRRYHGRAIFQALSKSNGVHGTGPSSRKLTHRGSNVGGGIESAGPGGIMAILRPTLEGWLPPVPVATTNLLHLLEYEPKWRNGRRAGLKNRWGQPRVGSTPTFGTRFDNILITSPANWPSLLGRFVPF